MPRRKRSRKVLLGGGLVLASIAALWFSTPVWFPWVLRALARKEGAVYSRYERQGFGRFTLHGLQFTNQSVRFRADRVEALVPNAWLWRCAVANHRQPFLRADDWRLEILRSNTTGNADGSISIYTNVQKSGVSLLQVQRWLPSASFSKGVIASGQTLFEIPNLIWTNGNISSKVALPRFHQEATLTANLAHAGKSDFQIHSDSLPADLAVQISSSAAGLKVQSAALWRSNHIDFNAEFVRDGILPSKASLLAADFVLPPEVLRLPGYSDLTGTLRGLWEAGAFTLELGAEAHPLVTETNLPAARLELHARGNTNSATIASAVLTSPGLKAELSKELSLHFEGPMVREPAILKVEADLERQAWLRAKGKFSGEVDLSPTSERFPAARFEFSGSGVGNAELEARTLTLKGNLKWPRLEIDEATANFADDSVATAHGKIDLQAQALSGVQAQFSGSVARRWLPAGYGYETLALNANFDGPLKALSHHGHAEATGFASPTLRPLAVQIDWRGYGLEMERTEVVTSAGKASLRGVLSLKQNWPLGSKQVVSFESLVLQTNGATVLELQKPARVSLERDAGSKMWRGRVEDFHWAGPGGKIEAQAAVAWPSNGSVRISAQNLHSDLVQEFIKARQEEFEITNLDATAEWTNGPARYSIQLSAGGFVPPNLGTAEPGPTSISEPPQAQNQLPDKGAFRPAVTESNIEFGSLSVEVNVKGDENGLVISNLVVASQTSSVAVARGFLPLTLNPGDSTNLFHLDSNQPVDFLATAHPRAVFWEQLAQWTGMALREPDLKINVSGTWEALRGAAHLKAASIELRKKAKLPRMDNLQVDLELDEQQARLTKCDLLVQNQPVSLSGQMPLGKTFWEGLKKKKLPNWEQASGRLRIEQAQISAFADLVPAVLSPQGELSLDLSLAPGVKVAGDLTVHGARTRPLATLGPIREIEVTLKFAERTVKLASAAASVGGAPIQATGQADLRGSDWLNGVTPPFEFALRGTNVPLSRQPESILRSDFNIAIIKTNGAPPLLSGEARLRDSFYLSDLTDLVPGRMATPSRRPPYFSIETPPLADWRLAVRVTGERGLRVRSTLFNGDVTANLRLQGTLKTPIALGDLKIDSGIVRFPFANLQVQQGFITLTSQEPYRPHLLVSAGSRKFGYDVRMELSGPADEPVILFTSTPPLSSDQLVLMLTAGELPRGAYNLTPQQKAQTVALFLGRDMLAKLGFSDQSEERLMFSSGEEISETGKPTYNLEYKLTKRWAVVGEYDRFNAFNAGLKWRVYSK